LSLQRLCRDEASFSLHRSSAFVDRYFDALQRSRCKRAHPSRQFLIEGIRAGSLVGIHIEGTQEVQVHIPLHLLGRLRSNPRL
jgi:hypothetical protein